MQSALPFPNRAARAVLAMSVRSERNLCPSRRGAPRFVGGERCERERGHAGEHRGSDWAWRDPEQEQQGQRSRTLAAMYPMPYPEWTPEQVQEWRDKADLYDASMECMQAAGVPADPARRTIIGLPPYRGS